MFIETQKSFANALPIRAAAKASNRAGLIAGTRVEAASGWRGVDSLVPGDAVYTFDGGLAEIVALRREDRRAASALHVPGGALGNCSEMWLMPEQDVMIEHDLALRAFGTPTVLIPAAALAGHADIRWGRIAGAREAISLIFAEEEIVWANSGALLASSGEKGVSGFFRRLDLDAAQALVGLMGDGAAPLANLLAA